MSLQEWSEKIWIIQLADDPQFSDELRPLVDRLAKRDVSPSIIVDLAQVSQINSSNLSQLLRLRKLMSDRQRPLRLVAPCDAVWSVFIMTGLDKVFHFVSATDLALADLQLEA